MAPAARAAYGRMAAPGFWLNLFLETKKRIPPQSLVQGAAFVCKYCQPIGQYFKIKTPHSQRFIGFSSLKPINLFV